MIVLDLVTACQNQWKGNTMSKNKDFKIEIKMDQKLYQFNWNYIDQENWQKVRAKNVIGFEFRQETLYIVTC